MTDTVATIGEFGLIARIHELISGEGARGKEILTGIGDDAASFKPHTGYELLVTCDTMVEGRHYLPERITPMDLGRRAMVSNISDIGAMGGTPLYALVSLGLKSHTSVEDVEAMYRGFLSELNPFDAAIIGGNLTKADRDPFIDITLIGHVKEGQSVRRSTARPGDVILVTGQCGQAVAGLQLLLQNGPEKNRTDHAMIRAYQRPSHRAREGMAIAETGCATAMIDTSDGFLGDLGHICEESGVGASVVQEKLPVSDALRDAASRLKRTPYEMILGDSDDYELIVTCSVASVERIRSSVAAVSDVIVTEVGRLTDTRRIVLILPDGSQQQMTAAGWDHFSEQGEKHE